MYLVKDFYPRGNGDEVLFNKYDNAIAYIDQLIDNYIYRDDLEDDPEDIMYEIQTYGGACDWCAIIEIEPAD